MNEADATVVDDDRETSREVSRSSSMLTDDDDDDDQYYSYQDAPHLPEVDKPQTQTDRHP